jgi:AP-3 complex subunit mu
MIHSFFIMTFDGEILIEKHWRGRVPRSVVEDFWTVYVTKASAIEEVMPVVCTAKYYFVHVITNGLVFLAVLVDDTPVMLVLELLQQMAEVFHSYFDALGAESVKENFSVVFQLLDEMVDNGVPICTEPSVLKERVPPPTLMSRARLLVGAHQKLDTSSELNVMDGAATMSWRKPGIRYTSNEILFDVLEEVDAIIDSEGSIVMADIRGRLEAMSKLSGMPEVALVWANPEVFDDASIHPCVKHQKYEQDKSLVFTPPDGHFVVMNYHHKVPRGFSMPFYVKPQISFHKDEGRVNVMVGLKGGMAHSTGTSKEDKEKNSIQKLEITVPLPKDAEGVRVEVNQGTHTYNATRKVVIWKVGTVSGTQTPSLTATVQMPRDNEASGCGESVSVEFRIQGVTLSGLKVDNVNIYNEKYKAYKGVKYVTMSGKFTVRT